MNVCSLITIINQIMYSRLPLLLFTEVTIKHLSILPLSNIIDISSVLHYCVARFRAGQQVKRQKKTRLHLDRQLTLSQLE